MKDSKKNNPKLTPMAIKYHIQIVANKELSRIPAEQLPVAVSAV